jgi:hypothetical protein
MGSLWVHTGDRCAAIIAGVRLARDDLSLGKRNERVENVAFESVQLARHVFKTGDWDLSHRHSRNREVCRKFERW